MTVDSITSFAAAVGVELGLSILVGGQHLHSQEWPRIVCAPVNEDPQEINRAGSTMREGDNVAEVHFADRFINLQFAVFNADFAAVETIIKALYQACRRVVLANSLRYINNGADWPTQASGEIASVEIAVMKVSISFPLIAQSQTPLVTPTTVTHEGLFNDEDVC